MMPRHSVALDLGEGPLVAFAQELRSLRDRLGSHAPSVDEISKHEHIPRSTLYAALRGQRLPSREVVSALARSWGGDDAQWLAKRSAVESALAQASQGEERAPAAAAPPPRSGRGSPGEVTYFTGRKGPMAELRAWIADQTPHGSVVAIYAIDGMAGVGKTAFARHAAQELGKLFPDGAIWIDLYGHTPGMQPREPASALEQLLLQLGVPPEAIKADLLERQDQWRYHLHGRSMLIVLDSALTSDQVLPLLPETPGCVVLVTSRCKLTGLTDAYPLSLDVLGWDEAEQLFVKLVGEQRCDDRAAVRQILAACGRLPLAIRLIAGRLRHHPGELLADVAADVADQTAALDTLVAEHISVRVAFEWSYRFLTTRQRRAFRLLGWHPGPEITAVVIAAIANVSPGAGKQLLRGLVDHNLLDQLPVAELPGGPRYRMHDLMRLYARERAEAEESAAEQVAAVDRLAGSYVAIAHHADRLLRPHASGEPGRSAAGKPVLAFADALQARTWLTIERPNLLGCVRAMNPSMTAENLSTVLAEHFRLFGFWADARYLYGQALTISRHLGDRRGEIDALRGLGGVEWLVGEYGHARDYHTQAVTLAQQYGHRRAEADALQGLGEVEWLVGEYDHAREHYAQALTLARQLGHRSAETEALRGLGQVERLVGDYGQAREYYTQALSLAQQLGNRPSEALTLRGLGEVERFDGEYEQAHDYNTRALTVAQQYGHRRAEADALRGLGEIEWLHGEYSQAREYHTQALVLARQLGYRRGEAEALRGLGEVEWLVGEYDRARKYHTQALALARQLGYRFGEVEALRGLGQAE